MTPDFAFRKLIAVAGFAALVTFPSLPLCAQTTTPPAAKPQETQPSGPGVASAVGAVSLTVTVVDDKGNPVKNLTAADLKLTDNGSEQKIQSFGPAAPTPAVFGLIGQTSSGQRLELGDERIGAVHFADHILPGTQNQVFVIQYASEVDLLADPTATTSKLHDGINQLGSPQFGQSGGDTSSDQSADTSHAGGSGGTLYDAIYLAATEELKKMPGQHVIVVVTDGVDHGSKESMSDAVEAAQSANAAIFAIYYKSEAERPSSAGSDTGHHGGGFPGGGGGYPGGGGGYPGGSGKRGGQSPSQQPQEDGRPTLEHMCSATGGYMIEGKHDKSDEAFNKLIALLHNQYTITFVPSADASASAFQRLSLTTLKKDVYPLMQEGYTPQQ